MAIYTGVTPWFIIETVAMIEVFLSRAEAYLSGPRLRQKLRI